MTLQGYYFNLTNTFKLKKTRRYNFKVFLVKKKKIDYVAKQNGILLRATGWG